MAKAIEQDEFEKLVKANMKRAYFSALAILGSHDDAAEASQMAFVKAFRNYHKFDKSKKFFTWYYKILKNLCLNMIRDAKHNVTLDLLENYLSDNENSDKIEQQELKHNLQLALFKLNAEERGILILKEFENYSYKEIAEILDIPIGTVMSRLFNARKKLAVLMKDQL